MRRADESVERLLAGLRSAEPAAGMEQRVMQALEQRAGAPERRVWGFGRLAACGLGGCAAALIVCVALVPGTRRAEAPMRQQVSLRSVAREAPAAPVAREQARRAVDEPAVRVRAKLRRVAAVRVENVVPVREARVISQPAPPEPITKQEKLLLQVAHTQDRRALEMLNPEAQRKQETEAKAEFDQFFGVSGRLNNQ